MSILLYHYKQITECISEVEQIETKVNSKKKRRLMIEEEEVPTTLDSYFINSSLAS
jgi:hypothetical protein